MCCRGGALVGGIIQPLTLTNRAVLPVWRAAGLERADRAQQQVINNLALPQEVDLP